MSSLIEYKNYLAGWSVCVVGCLLCLPSISNGQKIKITGIELEGESVNLYYDLMDADSSNLFLVSLYTSRDYFSKPVKMVSGDVGINVKSGTNLKIRWRIAEEFGRDFDSKISFEIRSVDVTPFMIFNESYNSMRRGRSYAYTWESPIEVNSLGFKLLIQRDSVIDLSANSEEIGHIFYLPSSMKHGSKCRIMVYKTKTPDKVFYTNEFTIQHRIPTALKFVPVALVGGAIYFLTLTADEGSKKLPDPIKP